MQIRLSKASLVNCEIIDKVLELEWEDHKLKVQTTAENLVAEPLQTSISTLPPIPMGGDGD